MYKAKSLFWTSCIARQKHSYYKSNSYAFESNMWVTEKQIFTIWHRQNAHDYKYCEQT